MGTVIEFITSRMMCISTPASSYDESTMSSRKIKFVMDQKKTRLIYHLLVLGYYNEHC